MGVGEGARLLLTRPPIRAVLKRLTASVPKEVRHLYRTPHRFPVRFRTPFLVSCYISLLHFH